MPLMHKSLYNSGLYNSGKVRSVGSAWQRFQRRHVSNPIEQLYVPHIQILSIFVADPCR